MRLLLNRKKLYLSVFVLLIFFLGISFRAINLDWGAPFYFHPDERNIASAVTQLSFPHQLNPHFFAYGSITIYLIYFFGILWNLVLFLFGFSSGSIVSVPFDHAIIISRLLSTVYSILTLFLLYRLITRFYSTKAAIFVVSLASFSIGLIQYAHFGTVESSLSFYSLLLFTILISYLKKPNKQMLFFSFVVVALLISIKVSSLILAPIPILIVSYKYFPVKKTRNLKLYQLWLRRVFITGLIELFVVIGIFCLTFPYAILDYSSFQSSMSYESSVALGTTPVFYTGDFLHTIPVLYQWKYIYPFIVNPFITILLFPALVWICYLSWKQKDEFAGLTMLFFIVLFFSEAFLFVKWTRYIIPTLPFIYILLGVCFEELRKKVRQLSSIVSWTSVGIVLLSFIWGISFVISVYIEPDTRLQALQFARVHIPATASIISETYDLGITPFNPYFSNITLINTYDLDYNPPSKTDIYDQIRTHEYFILPSQRVLASRLNHPRAFRNGYILYHDLLTDKLGYKEIYHTPCDIFCKITYMGNPTTRFEQTTMVFDRPTLYIFKNIRNL